MAHQETISEQLSDESAMTVTEVAQHLGLHDSSVRAWVHQKRIPARKQGRKWLIDLADVNRLLSENPSLGTPHRAQQAQRRDSATVEQLDLTPSSRQTGRRALATGILSEGLR